jgi:hypothetical protein
MTVKDLLYDSLRLIGVIEVAQGPSSDEFAELLRILNGMLDAWKTERLMAYTIISTAYTVAADGSVSIPHPVRVEGIWIADSDNLRKPWILTSQTRYLGGVYNDGRYPTATLTFNPAIPAGTTILVETWVELGAFASISQAVLVPPGYLEAITYNLALRVAPRYKDAMVSPLVLQDARELKANIKRMNRQTPLLTIDRALLGGEQWGQFGETVSIPGTGIPPVTGAPPATQDPVDLLIYQGDDYVAVVTVNGGQPVDVIAGYTANAQIRRDFADNADVVADMTAIVNSPYITIGLSKDQTVNLSGDYVWDLQITSPTGGATTILRGNVLVTQEVTRPPETSPPPIGDLVLPALPGSILPGASLPGGPPPSGQKG